MKTYVHGRVAVLSMFLFALSACNSDAEFSSGKTKRDQRSLNSDELLSKMPNGQTDVFERKFEVTRTRGASMTYEPQYGIAKQTVTMEEQPPTTERFMTSRPIQTDSFVQGHDSSNFTESFSISEVGLLDLLIVMDDSTSMEEEQMNLASKLDPLLSQITDIDWQIVVVTTSDACLQTHRVLRNGEPDLNEAFSTAIMVPLLASASVEKGFPMAIKALSGDCNGSYTPWLRADSTVVVMIVSDEDNCGSGLFENCKGELGQTPDQMVNYLRSIRPEEKGRIFGIIEAPGDDCSDAREAIGYYEGITATGGTSGRICDGDYTATLEQISQDVSHIIERKFDLSFIPDGNDFNIVVDGKPLTSDQYELVGKTLTLKDPDPSQITLEVKYSYGIIPKTDSFVLSNEADEGTISVEVNGVAQNQSEWIYDAAAKRLTTDVFPPDDATVQINYRENTELPDEVVLAAGDIIAPLLSVKVDGIETDQFTFDLGSSRVLFDSAPLDDQEIDINYRTLSGLVTHYTPAFTGIGSDKLTALDAGSGETIPVEMRGNKLVFSDSDVNDGRLIEVSYDFGYSDSELKFELPVTPVAGSVYVESEFGEDLCELDAGEIEKTLSFSCSEQEVGAVTINYEYVIEGYNSFSMPEETAATSSSWQVFIDDNPLLEFEKQGSTVIISEELLSPNSQVKIVVKVYP